MEPFASEERRENAKARIAARMEEESNDLPYRWGYFQAAILIPWTLLLTLASIGEMLKLHQEPWYISLITFLMGLTGFSAGLRFAEEEILRLPVALHHGGACIPARCSQVTGCDYPFSGYGLQGECLLGSRGSVGLDCFATLLSESPGTVSLSVRFSIC